MANRHYPAQFKADAVGAEISGRPLALAGALTKLDAAAPFDGGKTLAGFLPSLLDLNAHPTEGLHTLYISPLKALAVDIQRNLERPIAESSDPAPCPVCGAAAPRHFTPPRPPSAPGAGTAPPASTLCDSPRRPGPASSRQVRRRAGPSST